MARICAGLGLRSTALLLAITCGVVSLSAARAAETRGKPSRSKTVAPAETPAVDMFAAMERGDLEVKLIAMDATKGNIILRNKTRQPIRVQLPKAFAGAPVLAQIRPVGNRNVGPNGAAPAQNGANGTNQVMGGGVGQGVTGLQGNNANLNNGLNFGPNGGVMNIPPEKTARFRVPLVCLEHGKADPRATIPYEIKPIESFADNVAVQQLCTMLGEGTTRQRVAQVAAWHLANGLSYDDLAAKQLEVFGSPPRPFFTDQEMKDAVAVVSQAQDRAEQVENDARQRIAAKSTNRGDVAEAPVSTTSSVLTGAALDKPASRRATRSR